MQELRFDLFIPDRRAVSICRKDPSGLPRGHHLSFRVADYDAAVKTVKASHFLTSSEGLTASLLVMSTLGARKEANKDDQRNARNSFACACPTKGRMMKEFS